MALSEAAALVPLIPSDTTVVTALYPMKSKMTLHKYIDLMLRWWPELPQCRLVCFVPPVLKALVTAVLARRPAGHTLVIPLPFEDLAATGGKLDRAIWRYTAALDPEKGAAHSPELYAIWYEKKEFVLRAAALNPFQSEYFVWCDAGIGRRPAWLPLIQGFPVGLRIPRGKMLCLEVEPMRPEDFEGWDGRAAALGPDFSARQATIGGGILASDRDGWERWSRAYDAMLLRYHMAGRFIGKDQNIMAGLVASDPSLAVVVSAPASMGSFDRWFYLLFFLAGVSLSLV